MPTKAFQRFDTATDKISSVPKEELDRRLATAKKAKCSREKAPETGEGLFAACPVNGS
jgi:hypothetical protein